MACKPAPATPATPITIEVHSIIPGPTGSTLLFSGILDEGETLGQVLPEIKAELRAMAVGIAECRILVNGEPVAP